MFERKIEQQLLQWKSKTGRQPLIFRGARQTGKTTLIRKFSTHFENFIELNLEKDEIQKIFSGIKNIKDVVQSIEGIANQRVIPGETLLFLDEIQNSITAIKQLRYFYEEMPDLHVISAGSLLEVRMKTEGWSFPVGRVEFLYLCPVTFDEFLSVMGEDLFLKSLKECQPGKYLPAPLHHKALNLLADYMVVGGMPGAVNEYLKTGSFVAVKQYHETLVASFREDFAKYSKGAEVAHLKLVWDRIPFEVGNRLKYSKLAGANARSGDISKAFDILHDAMLVERIFPTIQLALPLVKKIKAAPKALFLDIGLCIAALHLSRDQIREQLVDPTYRGGLLEAFVGQELLALDCYHRNELYFWIREEKGTSSELDFVVPVLNSLVPIEVKSGSHGALKSLHQFLARSTQKIGVRLYTGPLQIGDHAVVLPGGKKLDYQLISLPAYLIFRLHELSQGGG